MDDFQFSLLTVAWWYSVIEQASRRFYAEERMYPEMIDIGGES